MLELVGKQEVDCRDRMEYLLELLEMLLEFRLRSEDCGR